MNLGDYIKALEEYSKALEIGYNTGDLPNNIIELSGNVEITRKVAMGKRGPQPSGKQSSVIRISQEAKATIRHLSGSLGISQSEVVDKAMEALAFMMETGKFTNEQEQSQ